LVSLTDITNITIVPPVQNPVVDLSTAKWPYK